MVDTVDIIFVWLLLFLTIKCKTMLMHFGQQHAIMTRVFHTKFVHYRLGGGGGGRGALPLQKCSFACPFSYYSECALGYPSFLPFWRGICLLKRIFAFIITFNRKGQWCRCLVLYVYGDGLLSICCEYLMSHTYENLHFLFQSCQPVQFIRILYDF